MRYWIRLLVVIALASAPVTASASEGAAETPNAVDLSPPEPWLRLRLDEPEGLELVPTAESREEAQREPRIGLAVGVTVAVLVVVGAAIGAAATVRSFDDWELFESP